MDACPLIRSIKCVIQEYYAYVFKIIVFSRSALEMTCCGKTESPTDLDRGTMLVRDSHLPVVWVFGGPCAGKSSMCQRIIEKYHFMHIDCDNVLRFEAMTQSSRGLQISAKLNRREPIPDEILVKILREIMPRNVKITNGYLLDNFPNSLDQGKLFEKKVCNVTALIYMKVSGESMSRRFVERREREREKKLATNSSTYHMPTVLDVPLRPEPIEVQIRNFEAIKSALLNEYQKVLYILNAEKNQDAIYRMADVVITEICIETKLENYANGAEKDPKTSIPKASTIKRILKNTSFIRKRQTPSKPQESGQLPGPSSMPNQKSEKPAKRGAEKDHDRDGESHESEPENEHPLDDSTDERAQTEKESADK